MGSNQPLTCVQLTCLADGNFHRDCAVRNCNIDGGWGGSVSQLIYGISAGGGTGTVVEGNHVLNVLAAVHWDASAYQTGDLVVRDNQFGGDSGINDGLWVGLSSAVAKTVSRLRFEDNCLRLANGTSAVSDSTPKGLYLNSSDGSPFGLVIVRGNLIEQAGAGQGVMAADVRRADHVIVEQNMVSLTALHPLIHSDCGTVKFFGNRKPDGTLVPGFDSTDGVDGTQDDELESEIEDNLVIALS